ncbi:MAG: cob(I)yrinic acid a,c-diamide adenosyltransferase [Planctomycetes bacterium]|nr:cob(I)yrinic acid a,c-diamide adenosyltransferase [Planctomycetota bacterium]
MKRDIGRGDDGYTGLGPDKRLRKDDARVELCGALDELVASLGTARPLLRGTPAASIEPQVSEIQALCFRISAATFGLTPADDLETALASIEDKTVALESALPPLHAFVIPGGSAPGAALHLARTICRRAERAAAHTLGQDGLGKVAIPILNRLSDLIFHLARSADRACGREDLKPRDAG